MEALTFVAGRFLLRLSPQNGTINPSVNESGIERLRATGNTKVESQCEKQQGAINFKVNVSR